MKCLFLKRVFGIVLISTCSLGFSDTIHEVKKGETLYSISRAYGKSVAEIQRLNQLSGNELKVGQKIKISVSGESTSSPNVKVSSNGSHTVQKGETLYSISRAYGVTVAEIQKANGLSGNELKVGQTIRIPFVKDSTSVVKTEPAPQKKQEKKTASEKESSDEFYTVQAGDTWLGIARDNGLSYSEILDLNNASESTILQIGQKVRISNMPKLHENNPRLYSSKKGDANLLWPVKTSAVTYVNGKMNGVSLTASKNEPVTAIMSGTVMFAGSYRGFGNVIFIQSKTGHIYTYSGLGSIFVTKGQYINSGVQIGTAGVDTYSQQSQISLMVFQNGLPIDPAKAPRG